VTQKYASPDLLVRWAGDTPSQIPPTQRLRRLDSSALCSRHVLTAHPPKARCLPLL